MPGYIEVCDLQKRTNDTASIDDPQNKIYNFEGDQGKFQERVKNDAGLLLYTVKWEQLENMIKSANNLCCAPARQSTSDEKCTSACAVEVKKR